MRITSILFFVLLFLLSSFVGSKKKPDTGNNQNWFIGKWEGMGDQVDGSKWKVKLNVRSKKKITIEYPDLFCSGKWKVVKNSGDVINLKENIIKGTDKCDQGCEMTVQRISDSEINVSYSLKGYSGAYAKAVLHKM